MVTRQHLSPQPRDRDGQARDLALPVERRVVLGRRRRRHGELLQHPVPGIDAEDAGYVYVEDVGVRVGGVLGL